MGRNKKNVLVRERAPKTLFRETKCARMPYNALFTLLHKSLDMHYVKPELVKNTLPSHHVKHDDTRVTPNCRRSEKQAVSHHPGWLDLSL
jgi:hypothetical protein